MGWKRGSYFSLIFLAFSPGASLSQGLECRLSHQQCVIVYEYFRMDKIQKIRDRDALSAMLPYQRSVEIDRRSQARLHKATQPGRHAPIVANEIARMALCEALDGLYLVSREPEQREKTRRDFEKSCM
jgi:hypothetical protein